MFLFGFIHSKWNLSKTSKMFCFLRFVHKSNIFFIDFQAVSKLKILPHIPWVKVGLYVYKFWAFKSKIFGMLVYILIIKKNNKIFLTRQIKSYNQIIIIYLQFRIQYLIYQWIPTTKYLLINVNKRMILVLHLWPSFSTIN